jgi:ABC-type Fe3+/spermidine/putrescine transport system ATPase subunit
LDASVKASAESKSSSETVLQLRGVSKFYGSVRAVDDLTIDVRKAEVLTLLGPSGCGKSTTMRLVMGLENCDQGEVVYGGQILDSAERGLFVPAHKRSMGMVFQSYAIWPHMTVFENVAYPLRVRGVNNAKTRDAVERALDLVGLQGFENRPSPNLSGGQQQRVALARSLVFEPQLLLLDEPFSNLDARLREQMRAEVRILQRRLGITVLFVTHDQVEALSLSDRIVVMKAGLVEQIGTPRELYERPRTIAVRDFLGQTITIEARAAESLDDNALWLDVGKNGRIKAMIPAGDACPPAGTVCTIAVRPEKVEVRPNDRPHSDENALYGAIEMLLFVGERFEARIALDGGGSIPLYLSAAHDWKEGQKVVLLLPAHALQVWPS